MADGADGANSLDVSKLKVAELKKELKARGLSTTGNKNELMERLHLSLQGEGALMMEPDLGAADSEEILDEDDVLAGEEALDDEIGDITAKAEDILPALDASAEKVKPAETEEKTHTPKKIVLNRNIIVSGKENQKEPENNTEKKEGERKVVKLSALTAKERLEMRAQKFGLPISTDAKKEARAARFEITSSSATSTTATTTTTITTTAASSPSLDILKKRAERFGTSVSSVLSKVEQEEKLKKRQERFGVTDSPVPAKKSNVSLDEKKKLRAERFKINK